MDFATPLLVTTKVGLAAASTATPTGPWIHITSFKIGSAYGYDPQKIPDDTNLDGDILYTGTPSQYKNSGDGYIDIILRIPADAGPFEFGEVGIFNTDDAGEEHLFAKAVFDTPQIKYSSLGTNVASSFTFHALIKLEQSIAVFKIDTILEHELIEVDKWSEVLLPYMTASPDSALMLVRELDTYGSSSLLHYSVPKEEKWTIGTNYYPIISSKVKNATANSIRIAAADVRPEYFVDVKNRKFVIEIGNRLDPYRSCSNLVLQGSDAVFTINPDSFNDFPKPNDPVTVYENRRTVLVASTTRLGEVKVGENLKVDSAGTLSVPIATNTTLGVVKAGEGIEISPSGELTADVPKISPDEGNRLEERPNGWGVWDQAPPDVAVQYVSAQGSDNNPGTKASPLRTLHAALSRIPKNNVGSFTIKLKAGQSFALNALYSLSCSLYITVYDDPIYGEAEYPDYNPIGLATNCSRATISVNAYAARGFTYPGTLAAKYLHLRSLSLICNPAITAPVPNVSFTADTVVFWGCIVSVGVGAAGAGSYGSTTQSVHTDWAINSNSSLGFQILYLQNLYYEAPGTVVPAKYGLPAYVIRDTNIKNVVKVNNVSNGGSYGWDAATKSLFGLLVNWDIFA